MNRLHPLAWWLWAAGLAVCAMRTTNPFVLSLIGAVACFVVVSCRGTAPWARSIGFFLRLGLVVIVIRVAIEIVFGRRGVPGHVLFTMPQVPLPHWAEGVSVGGAVTLESLLVALVDGLQIAVILLCFGAANSLASPYRLLRCLPAVLYETGVAVTVALAFTPELVLSIGLVRQARRLRGIPTAGLRGWRASPCRCWRARWTARSNWPPQWTPGATAAGWTWADRPDVWRRGRRWAGCCWPRWACTGCSTPDRCSGWASR